MLAALLLATIVGLLAPLIPAADVVNHVRPILLAGALTAALAAARAGTRWQLGLAALIAATNLGLTARPFLTVAPASAAGRETIKLVTFNVWIHNRNSAALERFLRAELADIVILQELHPDVAGPLTHALRDLYPSTVHCTGQKSCDGAILSRRPWRVAKLALRAARRPPSVTAWYEEAGGSPLRLIGTHLARPDRPNLQSEQLHALIGDIGPDAPEREPVILAGDFNLTPWSWHLDRLSHQTGLRRLATLGATWPAHRRADVPMVLIDHVLVSRHFSVVSYRIGPRLGSDHLPVIVELARRP